jgi:peptide/nickel transport system permease protein
MLDFMIRRFLFMLVTVAVVSVVAFVLIQLPPGDYLSTYIAQLEEANTEVSESELASLKRQYGLDQPMTVQYVKWIWGIVTRGDFGQSFQWNKPVKDLIWERFALTTVVAMSAMVFTFVVGIPIGIYSALRKYTFGDFSFTVLGYVGLATPNFMLALVLMWIGFKWFGQSVGGLFSPEYQQAAWSVGKFLDLLAHLWVPVVVLGTAGTAGLIRVTRAMLLDELQKNYVVTARAKGVKESRLIFKYPVRIALNPVASTIGWRLTTIISGAPIVAVVLSLPTTGPVLLRSLLSQDMYLAGAFFLLLCILTVVGTFLSDVLLAALDPRIRMER